MAEPPEPKATPFALFNNLNSSVVTKTEYFIKERKAKPLETS